MIMGLTINGVLFKVLPSLRTDERSDDIGVMDTIIDCVTSITFMLMYRTCRSRQRNHMSLSLSF